MAGEQKAPNAGGRAHDQYWSRSRGTRQNDADWGYGYGYARPWRDLTKNLAPLVERLRQYDALRLKLEQDGGQLADLRQLSEYLKESLCLEDGYERWEVRLLNHAALGRSLQNLDWNLSLQVRVGRTKMPVYYLCRLQSDYWSEYSMIVEDYHLSPGYPLSDERFAKIMNGGHEKHYLRIAKFRSDVARLVGHSGKTDPLATVDDKLVTLGRHVFQAAWHQDQQMGVAIAGQFGLVDFVDAMELLYLCLSGELCELRGAVDDFMLEFFQRVYHQPALREFLAALPGLDGKKLNDLPRKALGLYARLGKAFSGFLSTEVATADWSQEQAGLPLWKFIYANLNRLELVAGMCGAAPGPAAAAGRIEEESRMVIKALLDEMK